MNKVINIYKPVSLTPLQVVNGFKEQFPEYMESKISYAGRLDPLAEGVLILLVDEENKEREKYQRLDKEYEFEVLFGVATDTYDLLGIVQHTKRHPGPGTLSPDAAVGVQSDRDKRNTRIPRHSEGAPATEESPPKEILPPRTRGQDDWKAIEEKIKRYAVNLCGVQSQPYPPFSSFQIQKKPLFQWAKEGRLDEIEIPTKEIEIYSTKHLRTYGIGSEELHQLIIERVSKVQGKFRQKEILKRWEMFFEEKSRQGKEFGSEKLRHSELGSKSSARPDERARIVGRASPERSEESPKQIPKQVRDDNSYIFPVMRFKIHCGSGTYVRQIAHEMGKIANTGALTLSIKRTRVGEYKIKNSVSTLPVILNGTRWSEESHWITGDSSASE